MPAGNLREVFNRHRRLLEQHAPAWGKSPTELFDTLASADPSDEPVYGHNKKIYTDWLVRQLEHGLEENYLADTTCALRLQVTTPTAPPIQTLEWGNLHYLHLHQPKNHFIEMARDPSGLRDWLDVPGYEGYGSNFPGFVLDTLFKHDPQKGRNVPHMLRWLQVKSPARLLPEDLPKVEDDLKLLMKHRAAINPASKRDPANCETAQDLAALVSRFRPDFSKLPRGEMEDYALKNDYAKQLADTPQYRLIHITTQRGAQLLGKGTKWCTSWGDGDGRQCWFTQYKDGLFYVRNKRNNAVYQLHFGKWMHNDAADNPIGDFDTFMEARPGMREVLLDSCPEVFATALRQSFDWNVPFFLKILDFCHDGLQQRPKLRETTDWAIKDIMICLARDARLSTMGKLIEFCANHPNYTSAARSAADTTFDKLLDKVVEGREDGLWQNIWDFKMLCGKHHFLAPVLKWEEKRACQAGHAAEPAELAQRHPGYKPSARP